MKTVARISVGFFVLFAGSHWAKAQQAKKPGGADSASIDRGRYLVEAVAMCGRCHTPWNQAGEGQRSNWLLGGPVQIQATYAVPNWAQVEPRIAGRPPGTDAEFIQLLTTGISRDRARPKPPMPNFRLTRTDAESVLAYLKSLRR